MTTTLKYTYTVCYFVNVNFLYAYTLFAKVNWSESGFAHGFVSRGMTI
jgi:hypothetical protein